MGKGKGKNRGGRHGSSSQSDPPSGAMATLSEQSDPPGARATGDDSSGAKETQSEQEMPDISVVTKHYTLIGYGGVLRITSRPGRGKAGAPIQLEANHFRIDMKSKNIVVQQYDVTINRIDPITGKILKATKVEQHVLFWDTVRKNAAVFPPPEELVYDKNKIMFSLREIVECKNGKTLTLTSKSNLPREVGKDMHYSIAIKHAGSLNVNDIRQTYNPILTDRENHQMQFLDLLFRQGRFFNDQLIPAGRSFYFRSHDADRLDLGCGRELLRGFYVSARIIDNWQLSLNVNWNATAFYEEQPLIEFAAKYLTAQYKMSYDPKAPKPRNLNETDRQFLEKELRDVQLIAPHTGQIFKITGIATVTARSYKFEWKDKEVNHGLISVEDYYLKKHEKKLQLPEWPLLQRGKGKNITFMPMEVCEIVGGQRVENKSLTGDQHKVMIRKTAVTPIERRNNILNMLKAAQFATDARLKQLYISVSMSMAQVDGRVLPAPLLQYRSTTVTPQAGQWNGATLFTGAKLKNWAFVNFGAPSSDADIRAFADLLHQEGRNMGMDMERANLNQIWNVRPKVGQETEQVRQVLAQIKEQLGSTKNPLQLIVIILKEKEKDSPYNEIKRFSEQKLGIMTQCLLNDRVFLAGPRAPDGGRKGRQALSNIILKMNAKLDGVNVQIAKSDPVAHKFLFTPILFLGADVTHPDKGDKRSPSIAAVCGNIDNHPNKYISIELVQRNRLEIIANLKNAVKEILISYYKNTRLKPDKIVFYRDGVSEQQFLQVLEKELPAIQVACAELDEAYKPAITFIVTQKRHHTRFFKKQMNPNDKATAQNIPPGTVVDTTVTHPVEFDFYLCSHQGIQGTSRPTHYHVLFDQTGFTADELQALTYRLCHTYSRCTRTVSIPTPCYYAHHIAYRAKIRAKVAMPSRSSASSSSGPDGDKLTEEELRQIQELIALNVEIKNRMYWS